MDEENSYEEEDIIRDKEVNPKNKGTIRKDDIRYNINDIILERKDLNIFNFDFNSESEFLKTLLLKEKDDLSIINDELLDLELSSEINELNRQPKCKNKNLNKSKKEGKIKKKSLNKNKTINFYKITKTILTKHIIFFIL